MSTDDEFAQETVLAILAEVSDASACLDGAQIAARALPDAEIVALHVRVDPYDEIMPTEQMLTSEQVIQMQLEAVREGRVLHDVYVEWVRTSQPVRPTRWLDVEGGEAALVKEIGSHSMLNVIINPETFGGGHTRKAFHACIFDTRRPLLLIPRSYRARPLHRVLVAWRDTAPTRRALEAAVPWLKSADHIVLLSIGMSGERELRWAENFLDAQDLRCECRSIEPRSDMSVGLQILREARAANADWLVTGAYRYGEIIEWIFGGVTEDLLHATALPIFMHH